MSTEQMRDQITQELGSSEEEQQTEEVSQETESAHESSEEQQTESQFSEAEQEALAKGWVPKEEFKGDPDDWRNAKQFLEVGSFIDRLQSQNSQMRRMREEFDERLQNVNLMHKGQMEAQMKQLKQQFEAAVEDRDTEKANDLLEQQTELKGMMDKAETQSVTTAQYVPSDEDLRVKAQWELDNSWINTNSDKANEARGVFKSAIDLGKTIPEAIAMVEEKVSQKAKANYNPNRLRPGSVASGENNTNVNRKKSLTMADVSHQEMQMRDMFKDEKSFLKAVQDSRA